MSKDSWREAAELIGIIAIVASLLALLMELKQTQSASSAETYQTRAIDAIDELLVVADSEYLAPILAKTNYGSDSDAVATLNTVDHLRLHSYLRARMIDWDNEHYQYQNGFLSADFFEATTAKSIAIWAPRWRAIGLEEGRKEYREYVDKLLNEGSRSPE
jgi:hypothetical protein